MKTGNQWIPLHVPQGGSTASPRNSANSPTTSPNAFTPSGSSPVEFKVDLMEYRWDARESSPPASEFLQWGTRFFRKYCHAREFLYYPHVSDEVRGRQTSVNSESDEISRLANFICHYHAWDDIWYSREWSIFVGSVRMEEASGIIKWLDRHYSNGEQIFGFPRGDSFYENFFDKLPDSKSVLDDRSVVLLVINRSLVVWERVSSRLRGDRDLVLTVLNGCILNFIERGSDSPSLDSKYYRVPRDLSDASSVLKHAMPEIQDDTDIVQQSVMWNGLSLEFASGRLRDDTETVKLAVNENGEALQYASKRLRDSDEIVEIALANVKRTDSYLNQSSALEKLAQCCSRRLRYDLVCFECMQFECSDEENHFCQYLPRYVQSKEYKRRLRWLVICRKLRDNEGILETVIAECRIDRLCPSERLQRKGFCPKCMRFQCRDQSVSHTHSRLPLHEYIASKEYKQKVQMKYA
jgi:hypothetical protein